MPAQAVANKVSRRSGAPGWLGLVEDGIEKLRTRERLLVREVHLGVVVRRNTRNVGRDEHRRMETAACECRSHLGNERHGDGHRRHRRSCCYRRFPTFNLDERIVGGTQLSMTKSTT